MKQANKDNFKELINANLVLVDFYATWCGPCAKQTEELERFVSSRSVKSCNIVKVNVDETPELANEYNIESIPTLILFKEGKIVKEHIGLMRAEEIENMIEEYENVNK